MVSIGSRSFLGPSQRHRWRRDLLWLMGRALPTHTERSIRSLFVLPPFRPPPSQTPFQPWWAVKVPTKTRGFSGLPHGGHFQVRPCQGPQKKEGRLSSPSHRSCRRMGMGREGTDVPRQICCLAQTLSLSLDIAYFPTLGRGGWSLEEAQDQSGGVFRGWGTLTPPSLPPPPSPLLEFMCVRVCVLGGGGAGVFRLLPKSLDLLDRTRRD